MKPIKAWAGVIDGKIDTITIDDRWGCASNSESHFRPVPAVFRSRRAAREQYQGVCRVEIRPVGPISTRK